MRLVVTGASGMLGQDLVAAGTDAGHEVVGLSHEELDITDPAQLEASFEILEPEAVINCAAWTDVDGAEAEEAAATAVNGEGAGNVAAAAAQAGASVVFPSTDYVFDGTKTDPYVESDTVGPISAYGRSKLAGEEATAAANPRSYIVRTSWVFGPEGKNFVETMLGLAEKGEARVVDDQIGSPTYTAHLADGLLLLVETDALGLHHMTGAGSCSWYEFAGEIFRQAGLDVNLEPVPTSEMLRPATRPASAILDSERSDAIALPDWQRGLAEYLERRQ